MPKQPLVTSVAVTGLDSLDPGGPGTHRYVKHRGVRVMRKGSTDSLIGTC